MSRNRPPYNNAMNQTESFVTKIAVASLCNFRAKSLPSVGTESAVYCDVRYLLGNSVIEDDVYQSQSKGGYTVRCFVSASAFTNTRVIRKLIADIGVEIVDLHSLAEAIPLQVALKRELRKVDFAVFVLDRSNENVSYEVGLCDGIGKPVLIITSYESEHFDASYLAAHIVVRSDLKNTLTLRKSIEQFIEDVANKTFKRPINKPLKQKKGENRYNTELSAGSKIEKRVWQTFREGGISIVMNESEQGPDFIIHDNLLFTRFGGPIAVEVKIQIGAEPDTVGIINRFARYFKESDVSFGLLIYERAIAGFDEQSLLKGKVLPLQLSAIERNPGHLSEMIVLRWETSVRGR